MTSIFSGDVEVRASTMSIMIASSTSTRSKRSLLLTSNLKCLGIIHQALTWWIAPFKWLNSVLELTWDFNIYVTFKL
jgi:hypothetical protein